MSHENRFDPAKHTRILAYLFAGAGGLLVFLSLLFFFLITIPKPQEDPEVVSMIHGMFVVFGVFGLFSSIFPILGSWALFKRTRWAWVYSLILCVFYLATIPFGTAVGIYGLWALLKPGARELFSSGA